MRTRWDSAYSSWTDSDIHSSSFHLIFLQTKRRYLIFFLAPLFIEQFDTDISPPHHRPPPIGVFLSGSDLGVAQKTGFVISAAAVFFNTRAVPWGGVLPKLASRVKKLNRAERAPAYKPAQKASNLQKKSHDLTVDATKRHRPSEKANNLSTAHTRPFYPTSLRYGKGTNGYS